MRLYEKKCPNCGAGLEFDENAKSCKCEYCKRTFEIERDSDKKNLSADDFNLNELKGSIIKAYMFIPIIMIAIVVMVSIAIGYKFTSINSNTIYKDVSEFSNSDFGDFDSKAYFTISNNDDGLVDYHLNMSLKREKVYLIYNKDNKKNMVYVVYKAKYEMPLNKENIYTIYVPIKYEDLYKKSSALVFQLDNGKVDAPEYYFNLEHSEYSYGFQSMEDLEEKLIKPLESKYEVTKK